MNTGMKAREVTDHSFYLNTEYVRMRNGNMELKPVIIYVSRTTIDNRKSVIINSTELHFNEDGNVRAYDCRYHVRFGDILPFRVFTGDNVLKSSLKGFRDNIESEKTDNKNKDDSRDYTLKVLSEFV